MGVSIAQVQRSSTGSTSTTSSTSSTTSATGTTLTVNDHRGGVARRRGGVQRVAARAGDVSAVRVARTRQPLPRSTPFSLSAAAALEIEKPLDEPKFRQLCLVHSSAVQRRESA